MDDCRPHHRRAPPGAPHQAALCRGRDRQQSEASGALDFPLATLATISVVGSFAGVALAPVIGRVLGKKFGAIAVFATAVVIHITPVSLRLLGLAPPNGSPELLGLIYGEEILNSAFAAATGVLLASIIADVVEDAEVKTGRRSEGLLLSSGNLFRKMVSGVGVLIATSVLALIEFPVGARRNAVSPEVLHSLGLAYIPTVLVLYSIAIGWLFAFNITRARHEENLRTLSATALAAEVGVVAEPEGGVVAPSSPVR